MTATIAPFIDESYGFTPDSETPLTAGDFLLTESHLGFRLTCSKIAGGANFFL